MNKKNFSFLVVFLLVFSLSFAYAEERPEDMYPEDYPHDMYPEDYPHDMYPEDLDVEDTRQTISEQARYQITRPGLQIRMIQLENTINLKIKELETIINKLYEEEVIFDDEFLKEQLSSLLVLREYVLENREYEEEIHEFSNLRQRLSNTISETREYLREDIAENVKEMVKEDILEKRNNFREETALKNRDRFRNLAHEHNLQIREEVVQPVIEEIRAGVAQRVSQRVQEIDVEERTRVVGQIISEVARENKQIAINEAKQRIAQATMIPQAYKNEIRSQRQQEETRVRQEILDTFRQQERRVSVDPEIKDEIFERIRQERANIRNEVVE